LKPNIIYEMGDFHAIGFCIVLEVATPTKIKIMFVVA
jgi:hypothetical protein